MEEAVSTFPGQPQGEKDSRENLSPAPACSARRSALLVALLSILHSMVLNEKLERPCFVITS